jgi:hypothetical protein
LVVERLPPRRGEREICLGAFAQLLLCLQNAPSEAWREGLVIERLPPKRGERERSWRICAVVVVSSERLPPKRGERERSWHCVHWHCEHYVVALRTMALWSMVEVDVLALRTLAL